tara:strand:+ start:92 stop:334 length:243 start_codon:yes stop_codon:yes gene_type:complete
MASGAKYANGNYKAQQKAYNKTKHGLKIRVAANKADRRTKRNGTGTVGDKKDNSHKPGTSKTRLKSEHFNRGNERRKPRK